MYKLQDTNCMLMIVLKNITKNSASIESDHANFGCISRNLSLKRLILSAVRTPYPQHIQNNGPIIIMLKQFLCVCANCV